MFNDICHICVLCSSCMDHGSIFFSGTSMHKHLPYMAIKYLAYMCTKMLGLYAHIAYWLWDIHLLCGSHICSVRYAKYMHRDTWSAQLVMVLQKRLRTVNLRSARTETELLCQQSSTL